MSNNRVNQRNNNDIQMLARRDASQDNHILFINDTDDHFNIKNKDITKRLFLIDEFLNYNILKSIPRSFEVTTNNGSCKFNIELLKDTSSVINNFIKESPEVLQYHIDVDDDKNVLSKFEKLYQGEKVIFTNDDLPISVKITKELNINCCPNYMKEENQKNPLSALTISEPQFRSFIKQEIHRKFTIATRNKEYKCNIFGVSSSRRIYDLLVADPTMNRFEYDFNDENNEFQQICNLFNFEAISITKSNIDVLKEIADDLQIECIIPKIETNIKLYENFSKIINDKMTVVDSIEELFEWLFGIQKLTVQTVKKSIVESIWSQTEENVLELAAFIIQVVKSNFNLHQHLISLLIQLDKEANERNKLSILLPFITKQIMLYLGESLQVCCFIYNLYKQGIITKDNLFGHLKEFFEKKPNDQRNTTYFENVYAWFLPELVDLNLMKSKNLSQVASRNFEKFINSYYPDKMDLYVEMREKGKPSDELTNAIRDDDVETIQKLLSTTDADYSKVTIPYNIFESYVKNGETHLLSYAAAYGSIKCFKYLLLNHAEIENVTFGYAVYGGNTEIIRIVDSNQANNNVNIGNNRANFRGLATTNNAVSNTDIYPAILNHKNDIFDWILEQRYSDQISFENSSENLLEQSVKNGNAHSFIEIISKFPTSCNINHLIQIACKNGFARLANLALDIMNERGKFDINQQQARYNVKMISTGNNSSFDSSYVEFGNLSIFKIGVKINKNQEKLENICCYCIDKDLVTIFNYYFEELIKEDFKITQSFVRKTISISLTKQNPYYLNHLIEIIKQLSPMIFNQCNSVSIFLKIASKSNNFEYIKSILNLARECNMSVDISLSFIESALQQSKEICQYFIDQKYPIDYQQIMNQIDDVGKFKEDIFSILFDNANSEVQCALLSNCLIPAIRNENKDLVEFLSSRKEPSDDALIEAVRVNNIDIVNIILKYNSRPSFVNKKSPNGTALFIATKNKNADIIERLLKVKGINPSLYESNNQTPFILSIVNLDVNVMNLFIDFYGDDIQNQTRQIDDAIRTILGKITSRNSNRSDNNKTSGFNKLGNSKFNEQNDNGNNKGGGFNQNGNNKISGFNKLGNSKFNEQNDNGNNKGGVFNKLGNNKTSGFNKLGNSKFNEQNDNGNNKGGGFNQNGNNKTSGFNKLGNSKFNEQNDNGNNKGGGFNKLGNNKTSGFNKFGNNKTSGFNKFGNNKTSGFNKLGNRIFNEQNDNGNNKGGGFNKLGSYKTSGFDKICNRKFNGQNDNGNNKGGGFNKLGNNKFDEPNNKGNNKLGGFNKFYSNKPDGNKSGNNKPEGFNKFDNNKKFNEQNNNGNNRPDGFNKPGNNKFVFQNNNGSNKPSVFNKAGNSKFVFQNNNGNSNNPNSIPGGFNQYGNSNTQNSKPGFFAQYGNSNTQNSKPGGFNQYGNSNTQNSKPGFFAQYGNSNTQNSKPGGFAQYGNSNTQNSKPGGFTQYGNSNTQNSKTILFVSKAKNQQKNNQSVNELNSKRENSHDQYKMDFITTIKRFLEIANIDPNSQVSDYTLLSFACENNDADIVRMLLKKEETDVNAYAPSRGITPLMIAIKNKNAEIAGILINDARIDVNARNYQNKTALVMAVENNMNDIIELILKNEKFDPDESCLNYAFLISASPISRILYSGKSVDVNYNHLKNVRRSKSISSQSKYVFGNSSTTTTNNSNNNQASGKIRYNDFSYDDCSIETPLTNAVNHNDEEKVDIIIQSPSFDKVKSQLEWCVFKSLINRNYNIFDKLFALINNDANIRNIKNKTLLSIAVKCKNDEAVNKLLNYPTFDSNKNDILDAFVSSYQSDSNNNAPPSSAIKVIKIMELLYDFDKTHDRLIDMNKLLPSGYSFYTSIKSSRMAPQLVDFFLNHEADPNIPDTNGVYPLEYAIYREDKYFVDSLLKSNKIDLNMQIPVKDKLIINLYNNNFDSKSLFESQSKHKHYLHLAAISPNEILSLFLDNKLIDVNVEDDQGETPLMYACRANSAINVYNLFNIENIDYSHCNKDGKDALNILGNNTDHPKDKNEYKNALLQSLGLSEKEIEILEKTRNSQNQKVATKSHMMNAVKGQNAKGYGGMFGTKNVSMHNNAEAAQFKPGTQDSKTRCLNNENEEINSNPFLQKIPKEQNAKGFGGMFGTKNVSMHNNADAAQFKQSTQDSKTRCLNSENEEINSNPFLRKIPKEQNAKGFGVFGAKTANFKRNAEVTEPNSQETRATSPRFSFKKASLQNENKNTTNAPENQQTKAKTFGFSFGAKKGASTFGTQKNAENKAPNLTYSFKRAPSSPSNANEDSTHAPKIREPKAANSLFAFGAKNPFARKSATPNTVETEGNSQSNEEQNALNEEAQIQGNVSSCNRDKQAPEVLLADLYKSLEDKISKLQISPSDSCADFNATLDFVNDFLIIKGLTDCIDTFTHANESLINVEDDVLNFIKENKTVPVLSSLKNNQRSNSEDDSSSIELSSSCSVSDEELIKLKKEVKILEQRHNQIELMIANELNSIPVHNSESDFSTAKVIEPLNKAVSLTPRTKAPPSTSSPCPSPRSIHNRIKVLQQKSEKGDVMAQLQLASCYSLGDGVEQDQSAAFQIYLSAAEAGEKTAQFQVATCYSYGKGVDSDKRKAFEFYLKSAEQGFAKAQFAVGHFYQYAQGGVELDYEKAQEWYKKAADQGHKGAITALQSDSE